MSRVLCVLLIALGMTAVGCSKSPPAPPATPAEPAAPAAPAAPAPAATAAFSELHGAEWKLERFSAADAVPPEVTITLSVADNQLSGQGGCNRYSGAVTPGDAPGKILVGPIAGTRMACEPPRDTAEHRYLMALQHATSYVVQDGRLLISYADGENTGTLTYSRT